MGMGRVHSRNILLARAAALSGIYRAICRWAGFRGLGEEFYDVSVKSNVIVPAKRQPLRSCIACEFALGVNRNAIL